MNASRSGEEVCVAGIEDDASVLARSLTELVPSILPQRARIEFFGNFKVPVSFMRGLDCIQSPFLSPFPSLTKGELGIG